jgi:hypothetical protein
MIQLECFRQRYDVYRAGHTSPRRRSAEKSYCEIILLCSVINDVKARPFVENLNVV